MKFDLWYEPLQSEPRPKRVHIAVHPRGLPKVVIVHKKS